MSLKEFDKNDIFRNTIKAKPKYHFKIYNNTINLNNSNDGFVKLNNLNIPNTSSYYLYSVKDGSGEAFGVSDTSSFLWNQYGTEIVKKYPYTSSISIQHLPENISNEYTSSRKKIYALKNVLNYNIGHSQHYAYSSDLGDKTKQELCMIEVPSILYGSSIDKGNTVINLSYDGQKIATLQDINKNGELIETYGANTGSVAGVVLYGEGIILLTGSWNQERYEVEPVYETGYRSDDTVYADGSVTNNILFSNSSGINFTTIKSDYDLNAKIISLKFWNGQQLSTVFSASASLYSSPSILSFTSHSSGMYMSGDFSWISGSKNLSSNEFHVVKWDGVTWKNYVTGNMSSVIQSTFVQETTPGFLYISNNIPYLIGKQFFNNKIVVSWFENDKWFYLPVNSYGLTGSSIVAGISCSDGVYVGGILSTSVGYQNIAKWNGNAWSNLGTQVFSNNTNYACNYILSYSSGIYCSFSSGGIRKWDGNNWTTIIGSGTETIKTFFSASDAIYYNIWSADPSDYDSKFVYRWNTGSQRIMLDKNNYYTGNSIKNIVSSDDGLYYLARNRYILNSSSFNSYPYEYTIGIENVEIGTEWKNLGNHSGYMLEKGVVDISFNGINYIPTITMFAHAEKGNYIHSNNPTYIKYGESDRFSIESGSGYYEPEDIKIKNTVKYPYDNFTGSVEKQAFISKIGIFDENKKLIAVAKLSKPVKKTVNRDFTFKLKLDI